MRTAHLVAKSAFSSYLNAFKTRNLNLARSSRLECCLAYASNPKEESLDYNALSAVVVMNIQRDIRFLPHRDPKYRRYTHTIATLLSTSDRLEHVIYSLLFFHSESNYEQVRLQMRRCIDIIEIYGANKIEKDRLKQVMRIVKRQPFDKTLYNPSTDIQAFIDPGLDLMGSLWYVSLNFFRLEL